MGKLDGKVAVITGGSTGMALAGAELFDEATEAEFESLIPRGKWVAPKKSPLQPCSSPPTTPATSTAWNW